MKLKNRKNILETIRIKKHPNRPNYWNRTLQAIAKQL